ncbi:hypothetical protein [Fuchsiella alkaliacetigena]|uniref:hypothetical protein n=1 Tax=Fuchsiella alkaliacetigena TaxID=957042 RepID=UPI002009F796|nr:hypothetical protein [Fuchsiella alkaliacetigena]MCK8824688.1 hypothetical protein [Fuchsiella alkaliacetigena]
MHSYEEVQKTTTEFRDKAADFLDTDYDNFQTDLNFLKSYCDNNPIIQEILKPIRKNGFDFDSWYEKATKERGMVGSADGTLPKKELDAYTVIYIMLWAENAKDLILNYGHSSMYCKKFNDQIRKVNKKIISRFIRYIIRQLEEKAKSLKPKPKNPASQIIKNYGQANIANNSSNVNQTLSINQNDYEPLLEQLRSVIKESQLNKAEKEQELEKVAMIQEEISKEDPEPSRIRMLVDWLPNIAAATKLGKEIIELIS